MFQLTRKGRKGFTLIELMIVIAIIAILAAILVPNFLRARAQSQFTACQANLKSIATALEMYATDSANHYPTTAGTIALLVPNYLKAVPVCPSTGADTYTGGYLGVPNPDAFTVLCKGSNHTTVSTGGAADLPSYTATGGLTK